MLADVPGDGFDCGAQVADFLGVGGERLSVDLLSGEDGQVGGVGAEAGAEPADVGIRAGALGGRGRTATENHSVQMTGLVTRPVTLQRPKPPT